MRRTNSHSTLLAFAAIGVFAYGVEHWRSRTAARAGRSERERFAALGLCLVGPDGARRVDHVDETRQRLRRLAMDTSLTPSPTWIDDCLPLARALTVEGAAVDVTGRPGAARTQVARRARELTRAMSRVGLVWQVRAGDAETDLDLVAELLARTAAEIDLATGGGMVFESKGRRAPAVTPMPTPVTIDLPGLFPLPLGSPRRFLVGTPAPAISAVSLGLGAPTVVVRARDEARVWSLGPSGLVRVLPEDGRGDGLSPVLLDGVDAALGVARIAAPPAGVDPTGVRLDGVVRDGVFWLGEAVRGQGPVLARLPVAGREPATAVRLLQSSVSSTEDERIAVGEGTAAVFAAYTTPEGDGAAVRVVRATGGARAAVLPVPVPDAWRTRDRRPGLTMCRTGATLWLAVTGRDQWRLATVDGAAAREVWSARPGPGRRFDEAATLRCDAGGLLLHGRERPRSSPVVWCGARGCGSVEAPATPQPVDLPVYVTPTAQGGRRMHPEWPQRFARTAHGTVLSARASGTIVGVQRRGAGDGAWGDERVLLDAAATQHGALVQGVELYSDATRVLLVVTTAGGLHLLETRDEGRSWHGPTE
ncbi:MAG: hypothetical protein Q7V43_13260 [Myxococcales bacterium]|nr:hypothetical protein [Myxococcales bacterium]